MVATVEDSRLVAVRPDRDHPNGGFCPKAAAAPEAVHSPQRLRTPLRRTRAKDDAEPGWVPIAWDEALTTIAQRLNRIKAESGPEAVAFSRPAPGGSPACDWASYFGRLAAAFGSPNAVATSHICQWGRDSGSSYTYGSGLPTPHFEAASTILIWGHNPAVTHIQNWRRILAARKRGARLIVVDPRRSETVEKADLWLRLRPGSDTALAMAVVHVLLRDSRFDRDFVIRWTNAPFLIDDGGVPLRGKDIGATDPDTFVVWDEGRGAAVALDTHRDPREWTIAPRLDAEIDVERADGRRQRVRSAFALLRARAAQTPPQIAAERTGVNAAQIEAFARELADGGPLCYYSFNGIEQHVDTAQTNRAICILYALTGWIDAPGGNVTFARPKSTGIDGGGLLAAEQDAKRLGLRERPLSAARRAVQSYKLYDAILGKGDYPVRALLSFGGNLLVQNGDPLRGRDALRQLEFQVHIDTTINPSALTADLVLPAATPWECEQLATSLGGGPDTVGRVQFRPAVVPPQHEALGDVEIMARIALALGIGEAFWNGDVRASFREQLAPLGVTLEALESAPGGIDVPLQHAWRKYADRSADGKVRGFATPSRRIEIYSLAFLRHGYDPLPAVRPEHVAGADYPLRLTSYKLAEYCHSSGRGLPSLRRRAPRPFVEVHPRTADELRLRDGAQVRLITPDGEIRLEVRVSDAVAPGVVAGQTGWWEPCEELGLPGYDPFSVTGASFNLLISNAHADPISGSVPHKSYPCKLVRPAA